MCAAWRQLVTRTQLKINRDWIAIAAGRCIPMYQRWRHMIVAVAVVTPLFLLPLQFARSAAPPKAQLPARSVKAIPKAQLPARAVKTTGYYEPIVDGSWAIINRSKARDRAGQLANHVHHPGNFALLVPRELDPVTTGARMPLPPEKPSFIAQAKISTSFATAPTACRTGRIYDGPCAIPTRPRPPTLGRVAVRNK